jgi:hypothetical protein
VREQYGRSGRYYLVGPSVHYAGSWLCEKQGQAVYIGSDFLLALPVVEQEPREQNAPPSQDEVDLAASLATIAPREQKPRRMKANTGMGGTVHGDEHDESSACRSTVFRHCTPVEQKGES